MKKLNIKIKYRTYVDNINEDFFIPVLSKSIKYYRAVGYFSSKALVGYIKGLIKMLQKDEAEFKLIVSPFLTDEDFNAIINLDNQDEITELFSDNLLEWLNGDNITIAASKLFILLIQNNFLQVKVCKPISTQGQFHEKIGIFIDEEDNKIAIIGSNNETKNATDFNNESFNTFKSWDEGQKEYVNEHFKDFNELWDGNNPYVKVYDIKSAIENNVLKKIVIEESIEKLVQIIEEGNESKPTLGFNPYKHQKDATDLWIKEKKGILKFATGSGKTKTAILITEKIKLESKKNLFVIVVPDKTLVNQWHDELEKYNQHILKCFSDSRWENKLIDLSYEYAEYEDLVQFIITTNDTFFGDKFQRPFQKFKNDYMLIVDECHTWGTERILSNLPNPKMKLGLSATPELFFSESKTDRLLSFFGGILSTYSLEDAIKEKKLVPYKYNPIVVKLTADEKEQYDKITLKIVKMIGKDTDEYNERLGNNKALEMLLFNRARIVYGARQKLDYLSSMIDEIILKGKLLIYCGPTSYSSELVTDYEGESITQLKAVNKKLKDKNVKFAQYTSEESDFDRRQAIDLFKNQAYSTLVAIKCLDEGVDIPIIERAIILASSTNPREFIQRRGRIIRPYPGKEFAEIYDFLVLDEDYSNLNKKELDRFFEFARIALNFEELKESNKKLFSMYIKLGGEL